MSLTTPTKLEKLQQALGTKAKQEPSYRFYQLYDKVYREDVLATAYAHCRQKNGAPGVDGQRFTDIAAYGEERWLSELREELRQERYRPQAVRRVLIPKPGGVGERPLGIPTIRDRVAQTAARLVLEPIFEADFDEAAYGYRPGRGALAAVKEVHQALRQGQTQVVDADLSSYFDTIPHAELMKCLARRISDGKMLRLIKLWLKAPVAEKDDQGRPRLTGGKRSTRGIPQGGAISPLLANVYMHRFIRAFRRYGLAQRYGAKLVNYADDFVILCRHGAAQVLTTVRKWMGQIGLTINERKTTVRRAWQEAFDFLGYTFGRLYSPKRRCFYLGARPSTKASKRLREKVHGHLHRGVVAPWDEVVSGLNRTLKGWGNYFRYGTVTPTRHALDRYVCGRVRDFQRRRHKLSTRGWRSTRMTEYTPNLASRLWWTSR